MTLVKTLNFKPKQRFNKSQIHNRSQQVGIKKSKYLNMFCNDGNCHYEIHDSPGHEVSVVAEQRQNIKQKKNKKKEKYEQKCISPDLILSRRGIICLRKLQFCFQ